MKDTFERIHPEESSNKVEWHRKLNFLIYTTAAVALASTVTIYGTYSDMAHS
jgi:adenylate kinase